VHDFNPGLDNGLFWTVPVSTNSVEVEGSGKASLVVNNLVMEDYFNIVNALKDGQTNPATVSFQVHWAQGGKRINVRDPATGMAGEFVKNSATMAWSVASPAGVVYQSGPENTSASIASQLGQERNGVFFR